MAKNDLSDPKDDRPGPRRDAEVAVAMAPITPAAKAADPAPEPAPVAREAGGRTPHDGRAEADGEAGRHPPPPPAAAPARSGSGPSFLALLVGGILAGAIGFAAAQYTDFGFGTRQSLDDRFAAQGELIDRVNTRVDEASASDAATGDALEQVRETLSQLDTGLSDLRERVAAIEESGSDDGGAGTDAAARIDDNSGQVAELRAEVDRLAQQVNSGPSDTVEALQSRLEALAAQVTEQDSAIAAARDAAVAEARSAAVVGAVAEIRAAVQAGTPFTDALGTLQQAGVDAPAPLPDVAGTGVATLAELQEQFSDAARAALDASLSETVGDGALDRIGAFLASQTGARSLGEREGTGADAILSRAEARVREGDLEAALSEIEALPQSGREAMSDWIDAAETRLAALSAAATLAQPTNSN